MIAEAALAVAAPLDAGAGALPVRPPPEIGSSYGAYLLETVLLLGLICILAALLLRAGRRFLGGGAGPGRGAMRVVARLVLEPRRTLFIVEVAGRYFLVGAAEGGLARLAELDAAEVRAAEEAAGRGPSLLERLFARPSGGRKPPQQGGGPKPPRPGSGAAGGGEASP